MPSKTPFIVRWRNAVMDAPDLSWKAKTAAMPLVRHADLDGKNCFPGALTCAAEMSVGKTTIKAGWAELKTAGYLEVMPLPQGRRRTQGAVKVLRFPPRTSAQHGPPHGPSDNMGRHRSPNRAATRPQPLQVTVEDPSDPSGEAPHPGEQREEAQPRCAWEGCMAAGIVDNFDDHWCESHAAEMYNSRA